MVKLIGISLFLTELQFESQQKQVTEELPSKLKQQEKHNWQKGKSG